MEVFEKVLFDALLDVMDKVWSDEVEASNATEKLDLIVEEDNH